MVAEVVVPHAPALATIPNVELMHTGQWDISTGRVTVTTDDLIAAVAALDCPAVRRPILKLGHSEPDHTTGIRWDGEPAVGWVSDLRVAEDGRMLVGDYVGMPGWLGDVIASAYPDRSAEWVYDYRCQLGHVHPVVVTAMALLGVTPPGIGTLQSLQDVAALYGVQAATESTIAPGGVPVTFTFRAQGGAMPNPRPVLVAASVSVEDVRRAYYTTNPSWDVYIEEFQLDPPQLIVVNDSTGSRQRVPVTIGDGDGESAVTFGDPVSVVIRYDDAANAASAGAVLRWASKAESRPPSTTPRAEPARATTTPPDQEDTMSDILGEGLRQRLGIGAEATDEEILAALDSQLEAVTDPNPPPAEVPVPEGSVVVPAEALASLRAQAAAGAGAAEKLRKQERDALIDGAVSAGKIPPARKEHWQNAYDQDPAGVAGYLASAEAIIPVQPKGYTGGDTDQSGDDELYASLFGDEKKAGA